jgi:hypothetical protein
MKAILKSYGIVAVYGGDWMLTAGTAGVDKMFGLVLGIPVHA